MIIGEELTQDVETYCLFPGENPNDFMNKLKERIATNPQMEFVILCDIKGGSVHTALSQLCVHHNVKVFSGMNMNLAMDILLSCPQVIDAQGQRQYRKECPRRHYLLLAADDLKAEEDDEF